jgi:hypothetical protein
VRNVVDDLEKLRAGLRAMPVPAPRAGFVDQALANATAPGPGGVFALRRMSARPAFWVTVGAIAASIAWILITALVPLAPAEPRVVLAMNESRDVSLVIDSERDLEGATIRIFVSGGVALAGFEEEEKIEWLASLTHGANLLSLPVVAQAPGDARLVAEIEHEGRTRRVSVALHVAQPRSGGV